MKPTAEELRARFKTMHELLTVLDVDPNHLRVDAVIKLKRKTICHSCPVHDEYKPKGTVMLMMSEMHKTPINSYWCRACCERRGFEHTSTEATRAMLTFLKKENL